MGETEATTRSTEARRSKGGEANLELASLDLGDVEHVVDELEQVPRAALDHAELLRLLGSERPGEPLQDDPGKADDRVQRGS